MFHKTSSRIRQFILPKKDKKNWQEDDLCQNEIEKNTHRKIKSCTDQNQEFVEASFVRRTNNSTAGQAHLPPLPNPKATSVSLSTGCRYVCDATPPHSLKCDPQSGTSKRLCQRSYESVCSTLANSVATILDPTSPVAELYQSRSNAQLDLLEALALGPDVDNNKPSLNEYLITQKHNFYDGSTDTRGLVRVRKHTNKVSDSTITDASRTSQDPYSNQGSSKTVRPTMSPRTEPRGRFRTAVTCTIPSTQTEQVTAVEDDSDILNDSDFKSSMMLESPSPQNSPETLVGIQKRLTSIHSRQKFKQIIVDGRADMDRLKQIRTQTFGRINSRSSSGTSCSTESASTGSTTLGPFHLEDLPLRIKLAAGLLTQQCAGQRIEIRHPIASAVAPQSAVPSVSFPPNPGAYDRQVTDSPEREVILRSTNFSLTSLGFRHGDIRLERRRRSATGSEKRFSSYSRFRPSTARAISGWMDSTSTRSKVDIGRVYDEIDLSSFQMAISGCANYHWTGSCEDYLTGDAHPVLEDREVKIDELLEWWSSMELDAGALLQHHPDKERWKAELQDRTLEQDHEQASSSQSSDHTRGPLEMHRSLDIDDDPDALNDLTSPPSYKDATGRGETPIGSKSERGKARVEDKASLPPSPMQSLDPNAIATIDSFVPMGFNVDHDLVDFLRWQSECVESTAEGRL